MTTFRAIIHVTGEPDPDGKQRCLICRFVLADNGPDVARVVGEGDETEHVANWWPVGVDITQVGSGPVTGLWLGDNQGFKYSHIRCSKFSEGMEEELGFQLHPGDWLFENSPEAGNAACICSRCRDPILEGELPIRIFVPGSRDREFRFHPKCVGAVT